MKNCPTCKMTVDADSECPICHTTLTYEPTADTYREKYVFNRYLVLYIIKNSWITLLTLIIGIVMMITKRILINREVAIAFFVTVISLLVSIFPGKYKGLLLNRYNEEYAERRAITDRYLFTFSAIFCWIIIWVMYG